MEQLQETKAKELEKEIKHLLDKLMFTFDENEYMKLDQQRDAVTELARLRQE